MKRSNTFRLILYHKNLRKLFYLQFFVQNGSNCSFYPSFWLSETASIHFTLGIRVPLYDFIEIQKTKHPTNMLFNIL